MHPRLRGLFVVCALSPWLMASSCEDPHEPPPDCDERVGGDAQGAWTLHATGRREDCRDPSLNGALKLDVRTFTVNARPVAENDESGADTRYEADAFVERIRRAQYTLTAGFGTPSGLEFSGEVNTCQVTFVMHEQLSGGTFHEYQFDGFVDSPFRIYGTFEGRGPGSCRSHGEFDVDLR